MAHLNTLPDHASLLDVFTSYPAVAKPMLIAAQQILRGPSELSVAEREFLFAFGSGINACHFCHGSHLAAAVALGVDEQSVEAALNDIESAPVDANFKPLLLYVKKLTLSPSKMVRSDADAVRAAGWSDDQLHDAIAVCALHNFYNRWVDGCGVEASDEHLQQAGAMIAAQGYQKLIPGD